MSRLFDSGVSCWFRSVVEQEDCGPKCAVNVVQAGSELQKMSVHEAYPRRWSLLHLDVEHAPTPALKKRFKDMRPKA